MVRSQTRTESARDKVAVAGIFRSPPRALQVRRWSRDLRITNHVVDALPSLWRDRLTRCEPRDSSNRKHPLVSLSGPRSRHPTARSRCGHRRCSRIRGAGRRTEGHGRHHVVADLRIRGARRCDGIPESQVPSPFPRYARAVRPRRHSSPYRSGWSAPRATPGCASHADRSSDPPETMRSLSGLNATDSTGPNGRTASVDFGRWIPHESCCRRWPTRCDDRRGSTRRCSLRSYAFPPAADSSPLADSTAAGSHPCHRYQRATATCDRPGSVETVATPNVLILHRANGCLVDGSHRRRLGRYPPVISRLPSALNAAVSTPAPWASSGVPIG